MDELTLGGKTYISSKYAAKITGYAKDYVGQLCREGRVDARLVGRNWYVLESSIREHRFGKEAASSPEIEEAPVPVTATWDPPTYKSEPESPSIPPVRPVRAANPNSEATTESIETTRVVSDMQLAWKEWFETRQDAESVPAEDVNEKEEQEEEVVDTPEPGQKPEEETNTSDISNIEAIFGGPLVPRPSQEEEDEMTIPEEGSVLVRMRETPRTPVIPAIPHMNTSRGVIDLSRPKARAEAAWKEAPNSFVPVHTKPGQEKHREGSSAAVHAVFWSIAGLSVVVMLIGSGLVDSFIESGDGSRGVHAALIDMLQGESIYKAK
ncbi:MAG TPA: hypothetical protein VFY28_00155 [Candidatus Paceibacterota bacterium]|nr:hypothetical protein [Candidatus Paceibacterota bacterium]